MAETLINISSMECVDEIYVVTHPDYMEETENIAFNSDTHKIYGVLPGGDTRHESVENALGYLEEKGEDLSSLIAIFDGDRPGIEEEIVEENYLQAERVGAAVTALPAVDSVFSSDDGDYVKNYLDRKTIFLAQTPQTFRFDIILNAYKESGLTSTDDASLVAQMGQKIVIVEGNRKNDKITYPGDMDVYLLRSRNQS